MARQRNPRRIVIEALREIRRKSKYLIDVWDISMRFYDKHEWTDEMGRTRYEFRLRPRTAIECPENQLSAWSNLATWARTLRVAAEDLEEFAMARHADVKARQD